MVEVTFSLEADRGVVPGGPRRVAVTPCLEGAEGGPCGRMGEAWASCLVAVGAGPWGGSVLVEAAACLVAGMVVACLVVTSAYLVVTLCQPNIM